jgi:hypothetical protein
MGALRASIGFVGNSRVERRRTASATLSNLKVGHEDFLASQVIKRADLTGISSFIVRAGQAPKTPMEAVWQQSLYEPTPLP